MSFFNIITDVFVNGVEGALALEEERELLAAAQLGDEAAKLRLIVAYAPALRNGVAALTRTYSAHATHAQPADLEDIRMQAIVGVLRAIDAFDPTQHQRLAAIIRDYVRLEVEETEASLFTVPPRTLRRFFGILREAEGDVAAAAKLAPEREMRPETFAAVLDALRNVDSYDALTSATYDTESGRDMVASPVWDGSHADVEDRVLVEAALDAVGGLEKDVTRLAYGFSDYEPVPDAEIAERLGMSRPKIQRTRTAALGKMRLALGVA